MREHIVASFDEELEKINLLIHKMGSFASEMVTKASQTLCGSDNKMASEVIANDLIMDAMQAEVDEMVVTLIAKRQPLAQDLRMVIGAIRMANELERIGDLAKNIAKRAKIVGNDEIPSKLTESIVNMAELVNKQIIKVVDFYTDEKAKKLPKLRNKDKKIDVTYSKIFSELLTYMIENPRKIATGTHFLFCAKNLERMGDHVTNIAENAYYIIRGKKLSSDRPRYDGNSYKARSIA